MNRAAAFAGAFYPSDPLQLKTELKDLFSVTTRVLPDRPLVLIVPHAGYQFSGQVAAWGYRQLNDQIKRVWLIGASHRYFFNGLSVWPAGEWSTPLGRLKVDPTLTSLYSGLKIHLYSPDYHRSEHTLEVQLPFLQSVINHTMIVPWLLSQTNETLITKAANFILSNLAKDDLVVISTDLSHYPDHRTAVKTDKETIKAILSGDSQVFQKTVGRLEASRLPNLETACCGKAAVCLGLEVVSRLKLKSKLLQYQHSGQTSGQNDQVVGYAGIGFYR
jgi:hypothetical protein